ncbi:MJ0042-type zinc finger domain-containing protein [Malonomonas rubra]|uniref:MJ0042-type zinc finger domain-containing protein n=1 Tax=Malonomonas rubra TaxID=57040 RepID=UPI0026EF4482|nr:MJ0042-type zinc finger domain-containing protein [Malonomonas rubra]
MSIQCTKCKSRYHSKSFPENRTLAQVKCQKCEHRFTISNDSAGGEEDASVLQTILMVDDARFFRELMTDLLKERNVRMLKADSAAEASSSLQEYAVC